MSDAPFSLCFHEAGHAIAARALGVRFRQVSVVPNELDDDHISVGRVRAAPSNDYWTLLFARFKQGLMVEERRRLADELSNDWRASVKVDLAGDIAEKLFHQWHGGIVPANTAFIWGMNPGTDRERAAQRFGLFGSTDPTFTYERAAAETEAILIDHWRDVVTLAVALRRRQELSHVEVRKARRHGGGLAARVARATIH
jgi:hypothetical protein